MTGVDYAVQAELHRAAFEQGPDAIIVVSTSGSILAANVQAELLTGRSRKDLIGRKVEDLIPADLRERHVAHRTAYARNPYRRLMGPDLDLSILQHSEDGDTPVRVDINLAPAPVSIGVVVVLTIRQRDGAQWGGGR